MKKVEENWRNPKMSTLNHVSRSKSNIRSSSNSGTKETEQRNNFQTKNNKFEANKNENFYNRTDKKNNNQNNNFKQRNNNGQVFRNGPNSKAKN